MRFATYEEASTYARKRVKDLRCAHGIESLPSPLEPGRPFHVFMLPNKANRYGFEARCEAIEVGDV